MTHLQRNARQFEGEITGVTLDNRSSTGSVSRILRVDGRPAVTPQST